MFGFGKRQLINDIANEIELLRRDFIVDNMNASVNQTQICFKRAIDILKTMRPKVLEQNMKKENMDRISVAYWIVNLAAFELLRDSQSEESTYYTIANYMNEKRFSLGYIQKNEYEETKQFADELVK